MRPSPPDLQMPGAARTPARRLPSLERIMRDPGHSFRCQTHDFPCDIARWNYHPEHEIHLIRRSSGRVFVGDHVGTFEPGHLAFVNSNVPHNWVTENLGGATVADRDLVIQFDPHLLAQAADTFPEFKLQAFPAEAFGRSWEYCGETARDGAALMEEIHASSGLLKFARFLELIDLLGRTAERAPLATAHYVARMDQQASDLVHQAITLVLEALPGDVQMTEIAARLDMTPTAFSRFFKRNTGHNFVDYLRKLRIAQACRMLSDTDEPITEICFAVGYFNISNFNRNFRAERGMTPSAYRRAAGRV
ncbi:MAG: AraC family transcriptional regulator [Rhizobiaceae bacterium]|nr:AraC family transcriptional regulator [Rhizobiaceae bacterium]